MAVTVHGGADEAPGHAAHQLVLGGEDPEVRAAEAHRHPEPLPFADDDVGAELPGSFQDAEVHRVGNHDQQRAGGVRDLRGGRDVLETAVEVRRLDDERRGLGADERLRRFKVGDAVGRTGEIGRAHV